MFHELSASAAPRERSATGDAWDLVRGVAHEAERIAAAGERAAFDLDDARKLRRVPDGSAEALVEWRPHDGWTVTLPADDPRHALIDLYLPICEAGPSRPLTVGHLGQSIDGFIATHSGDSQFVTGEQNLRHMHRMRALCDAVVVGAGTVAADDPQLTTRQVTGASPLRVVLDPMRRLSGQYRVFHDAAAPTLYVCGRARLAAGELRLGSADVMGVHEGPGGLDLAELIARLRDRGCARIFVEGGGVTVSAFLAAKLLDRLHVAVAPFLIGAGRPAIRLPAPDLLRECARPKHRVFRMGTDVLFDCDLTAAEDTANDDGVEPPVTRII